MKPENLNIALVSLDELRPFDRNARTHPRQQIADLKESIRRFGFTNPLVADLSDGGVIAAGHGRILAVKEMLAAGEKIRLPSGQDLPDGFLPVVDCSAWTEGQRRSYTLSDNKISDNSGWDDDLLAAEIGALIDDLDSAPDQVLGFSQGEVDKMFEAFNASAESDGDAYGQDLDPSNTPIVIGSYRFNLTRDELDGILQVARESGAFADDEICEFLKGRLLDD